MDGRIGSRLCRHLPEATKTTRRNVFPAHPSYFFNMLHPAALPDVDIVYVCAGINGAKTCALDPIGSYKVNVDGTIWLAEHYRDRAIVVWISSIVVEWSVERYADQKRAAEDHLRRMPHVRIVRAGRVTPDNVDDLCYLLIRVGRGTERMYGPIVMWGEDEAPYAH